MPTRSWLRYFVLFLPLTCLLGLFSEPASAGGSRHPYFNDRGTLEWYHSFAEAKRVAQRDRKIIFIEYGRKACSNCRKLAARVLPHSRIRGRLSKLAIGLAAECDHPEREVALLFQRNVRNARTLPYAAFITPRGRWITGWGGYAPVDIFETHLAMAEARHRRIFGRRTSGVRPTQKKPATRKPAAGKPAAPLPAPSPSSAIGSPDGDGSAEDSTSGSPTEPTDLGYTDADLEGDDDGEVCVGGACSGGNCAPPAFGCGTQGGGACAGGACAAPGSCTAPGYRGGFLNGVKNLITGRRNCPPKGAGGKSPCDVPEPGSTVAPTTRQPGRSLATANRPPADAPYEAPTPSAMPFGDPDAPQGAPRPERAPDPEPSLERARAAAATGDWAEVLRYTRGAGLDQSELRGLNRQAHAWAHGRLAFAVRAVRELRYDEAQEAMGEVSRAMLGEPESVDAQRGQHAIVRMQDMMALADESPLRSNIRKTAYEEMRGTRWAPLFSAIPHPSAAISKR